MKHLPLLLISILLNGKLVAENRLQLKSQRVQTTSADLARFPKRLAAGRSHVILQFRSLPAASQLAELEGRGISSLRYVPDSGYLATLRDDARLEGLDLAGAFRLETADKLSSLLPGNEGSGAFLVEFHPDVDAAEARTLTRDHLLAVRNHPDLLPNQILVEGSARNARRLAEWDEVAYIYPASRDLVEGRRVHACGGAYTAGGRIGQYVAHMGPGWGSSGGGAVQLGVHFTSTAAQMSAEVAKTEILRALGQWSRYVQVDFLSSQAAAARRMIDIQFALRDHGDGYPFDASGKVLAHTFYPAPPNPEPLAGDMHFNAEENWGDGDPGTYDLFTVALHEAGHALGLGHSDNPGAVMYPYYRKTIGLEQEDISAVRELYVARQENPAENPSVGSGPTLEVQIQSPAQASVSTRDRSIALAGTVVGGAGAVLVSWTSDRGSSGTAAGANAWTIGSVPLAAGLNVITVTARDANGDVASNTRIVARLTDSQAPALAITYPVEGQVISESSVAVAGTAAHAAGIERVVWSSQGLSGTATGTTRWTAGPIALRSGVNTITITAFAVGGATAEKTVSVTYKPAQARTDRAAPTIAITYPASTAPLTYAASIQLQGTASDDTGVTQVTWTDSLGNTGAVAGTTSWTTSSIPLREGANTITVKAFDAAGNSGSKTVVITRKKR